MFGGKNEDGQIIGNLRILKPGTKPLQWIHPETEGKPPCPRYMHSMTFIPSSNFLFVFGGYNDFAYFNDCFLLSLNSLSWMSCKLYGASPAPRASHCALWHGSQVILFGGINSEGFLSVDIAAFEFDSKQAKEKLESWKFQQMEIEEEAKEGNMVSEGMLSLPGELSRASLNRRKRAEARAEPEEEEKEENFLSLMPVPVLGEDPVTKRRMKKLTTMMIGMIPRSPSKQQN